MTGRHSGLIWAAILCAAIMSAALAEPTVAQTTGINGPAPGIGLTDEHKRVIYREIGDEPARPLSDGSRIAIGNEIPDSLMLNEMPISLKDKVGLLRDFKFAKLPDERIVIVDPAQRRIVDIVTKSDASR